MKKIYESPESLTVVIQAHGRLLDMMSPGGDDDPPGAREYNSSVLENDDTNNKGGKEISNDEW